MGEVVATRLCAFRTDPRGFVLATVRNGAKFDLPDAIECIEAIGTLVGSERTGLLVDIRHVGSQTPAARDHFMGPETAERVSAVAILVGSPVSRMIGNFFLRRKVHLIPTRLFTELDDAAAWLGEHRP